MLIDAPCSGTGVVRRHPEIKWRLTPEGLTGLTALQDRLLGQCAFWARPGGRVLYATCSLLPEEGEHITAAFLRAHEADFILLRAHRWWPAATTGDAFYAALLLRRPDPDAAGAGGGR